LNNINGGIHMKYKDEKGNTLYGFSQENLEKTNREISKTNQLLKILILFIGILVLMTIGFGIWIDTKDIFTRLIG
tara:strand:- start:403 stop:627 length:225 start_codon:yes stop_codon:yes gene_type:complete